MPFDPEEDLYTAEPKLLSIDCLPFLFASPAPPDYYRIMAANARYHLVPEDGRPSMDSSAGNEDLDVLLVDPQGNDDEEMAPKKGRRFTCHPTAFLRLVCVCVFIPSIVLLIIGNRRKSIPAIIFACIALVRNLIVLFHHTFSEVLRVEFRNRSPKTRRPHRRCPEWAKHGRLHLFLDLLIIVVLLITTIIATFPNERYRWSHGERTEAIAAGCILSFVGILVYTLSLGDLGKPSNIKMSGSISFNYSKCKDGDRRQPQTYRDIEASGGIGIEAGKSGTDSPVVL